METGKTNNYLAGRSLGKAGKISQESLIEMLVLGGSVLIVSSSYPRTLINDLAGKEVFVKCTRKSNKQGKMVGYLLTKLTSPHLTQQY